MFVVKGKSTVFLKEEAIEGVYEAPSAIDAIEVLEDGLSFEYTREEIERNTLSSTIEVAASRLGIATVSGSIPTELKAGMSEGVSPKEDLLYKSLLGGKRQLIGDIVTLENNTTTELFIDDADIDNFSKNDIIMVKEAGNFEVRPILEVDATIGAAKIVLAIPLSAAPSDNVEIAPYTIYHHSDENPTFSTSFYIGGKIKETIPGCRALSGSLEGWEGGQTPSMSFNVEALDLNQEAEEMPSILTPDFSNDALPPVILNACIWINQDKIKYNTYSMSMENTKADILNACSPSGKVGSRYTQFVTTGEVAPYMDSDNVDRFESFNQNDDISVFGYAYNPDDNAGEIKNVVAFWIPQAKITNMPNGDLDGIMTNNISFKSYRKDGEDTVFLGFI